MLLQNLVPLQKEEPVFFIEPALNIVPGKTRMIGTI